jgi:hypothetical protein
MMNADETVGSSGFELAKQRMGGVTTLAANREGRLARPIFSTWPTGRVQPRYSLTSRLKRLSCCVRDMAGNVAFYAQDPTPTGTNPYFGTTGDFNGATYSY